MKQKYFPIFIDLSDKKIVVIGGGVIATRRIQSLQNFAGSITVVAPEITEELHNLYEQGVIMWLKETYRCSQLDGAYMVVAATNKPQVNHQIKEDCNKVERDECRQMLVSVVDDRTMCDFYFPGIVQTESLVIGINSGGENPGLVKRTRETIQKMFGTE